MQVTDVACGVVRALSYVSIAPLAGVLAFVHRAAPQCPEPSVPAGGRGTAFAQRIRVLLVSGAAIGGLADDLHLAARLEHGAEAGPHRRLVVGDHEAQRPAHSGSTARTA